MKLRRIETRSFLYSPHFWALIIIVSGLSVLYYLSKGHLDNFQFPGFRTLVYYEFIYRVNGSLFFIPFIYATIVFRWRGALITQLISEVIILPYFIYMSSYSESLVRNIFYSLIPILVLGLITLEFMLREKDRKLLADREAQRQIYMAQIFKAQEDERQRIAQELHDDTLQMLYVIANRAHNLLPDGNIENSGQQREDAEWVRNSVLSAAEKIRRISIDLRPSILDDLSLVPAIRWLIDRLNQDAGPQIQLNIEGQERKVRSEADVMIFRIIQEALNNARKYSEAALIEVTLGFTPDTCTIIVQDNGKGFVLPQKISTLVTGGKLGLVGMQQRAKFLGGTFDIYSQPGNGTTISVEVKA